MRTLILIIMLAGLNAHAGRKCETVKSKIVKCTQFCNLSYYGTDILSSEMHAQYQKCLRSCHEAVKK